MKQGNESQWLNPPLSIAAVQHPPVSEDRPSTITGVWHSPRQKWLVNVSIGSLLALRSFDEYVYAAISSHATSSCSRLRSSDETRRK